MHLIWAEGNVSINKTMHNPLVEASTTWVQLSLICERLKVCLLAINQMGLGLLPHEPLPLCAHDNKEYFKWFEKLGCPVFPFNGVFCLHWVQNNRCSPKVKNMLTIRGEGVVMKNEPFSCSGSLFVMGCWPLRSSFGAFGMFWSMCSVWVVQ